MTPAPVVDARAERALAGASSTLWRLRELLDLLTFKLEEERLLLAAGRARWLGRATHEVELVLAEIRRTELLRSVEVESAAEALGLPAGPTLSRLAQAAPPPWNDILADHRAAFLAATGEISAIAESNRELLTASYRAVQETLSGLRGERSADAYTAAGVPAAAGGTRLFDQTM
jgi:hypothetical protein